MNMNTKDYQALRNLTNGYDPIYVLTTLMKGLNPEGLAELEKDIFRLSCLLNDESMTELERIETALGKLNKIDSNEVVTPKEICNKMIDKLEQSKYLSADKILEVNSKTAEFTVALYKKFGIEVARKVYVIPSSNKAREFIKKFLRILKLDESQCLDITANEFLDENMGKFDIVLMNPPYDRDFHLKFLKKAIEVGEDVVSVQPIRWIKEVAGRDKKTSRYNKYKNSISDHIVELESINPEEMKHIFNITYNAEIGIYVCNKIGGFDYDAAFENLIITKVLNYIKHNYCIIDIEKQDGYRVRMPLIVQGKCRGSGDRYPALSALTAFSKEIVFKDGKFNNKWWHEYYAKNHLSKTTDYITHSIKFNSEEEGLNFIRSLETDFGRYIESILITDVHVNNKKILWMGNAVNPRTGLKGYESEWTSEDFEKFFNLTEDEIKLYRDHIEAFKIKRAKWFKDRNKIDKMTWEER